jgi:hypothetical protein
VERPVSALLSFVAVAALVASCGSGSNEQAVDLPAKNIDQWVMPLDAYAVGSATLFDYAENILVQPCMEEAGFAFDSPWVDLDADPPVTSTAAGRRIFDTEIAAQWGYHDAPSNQPNAAELAAANTEPLSDAAQAQFLSCLDSAREQVPLPSAQDQLAASLASAAWDATLADSSVLEAAERWRACMAPVGVSDLPDLPFDMPSASLSAEFGLDGDGVTTSPGARELEVAAADASCRESSGFRQTVYDLEWEKEASALQENADTLTRAQEHNDARRAAALKVVNEAGAA